ncbi:hypothetical protein vseg_018835 [Gypsophila vaccaria]
MAENRQISAINVGGKGSSLTSSTIFSIANNLLHLRIDSSLLDKLHSSPSPSPSSLIDYRISFSKTLTSEETRASLTVFLVKLLNSTSSIRAEIPKLIAETLNSTWSSNAEIPNFEVSEVEKVILDECVVVGTLEGVCALLDYGVSSLSPVGETVAALSCEAAKAKVSSAFNLVDSGDGKCLKDDAGVAGDLKVLLNGSKLIGKVEYEAVSSVPEVFGGFREVIRAVHSRARVGLNCGVKGGVGKAWGAVLSCLGTALRNVGEGSLSRVGLNVESVGSEGLRLSLRRLVEEKCPSIERLRDGFKAVLDAGFEEEYVNLVHSVYDLFGLVRMVVVWELVTAFVSLEGSDLVGKKVEGGGDTKVDKKSDKRKKVLGKGTAVVLQLIKDRLSGGYGDIGDEFVALEKLGDEIHAWLDPKVLAVGDFVEKIKEIVESNESRRLPKLAKGTRDFAKEQMAVRERAFAIITEVFKRHGAMALDTPVFELRETLMGKYGEDSKLIYDLADQGGELCSLRYDLTVPFARYVAMNSLTSFKRYQIAKVYRRDNPSKGRYREFYQCDFDIAGQYEKMGPDFEVIKILTELLDELNIGSYEVKLNHRKLLDGMLDICGVPPEKFRTICSSIDKLDKQSFDQVKKEMVEEKGLSAEIADRIGSFVKDRGSPLELLAKLRQEGSEFLNHEGSAQALSELEILFKALERAKGIDNIVFDLSLARGLDYYTGVIYEAVFKGTTQVGSIAAGGRYDNLIGMFGSKQVPAVGVSLGIERVFAIMEQNQKDQNQVIRASETQVLVGVMGDDLSLAAELAGELWSAKIKAEYVLSKKVMKIFERAEASGIPFAVMVGDREVNAGIVKVRNMQTRSEDSIPRNKMVEELQSRLKNSSSDNPSLEQ